MWRTKKILPIVEKKKSIQMLRDNNFKSAIINMVRNLRGNIMKGNTDYLCRERKKLFFMFS